MIRHCCIPALVETCLAGCIWIDRMLINFLGKLLFPKKPAWQRQRDVKILIAAGAAGILLASMVGLIIYLKNSSHQ